MKLLSVSLAAALSLVAAGPTLSAQNAPRRVVLDRILVKVNGEIFTQTNLEEQQIAALREQNRKVEKPADLQDDATLRTLLAEVTPDILIHAIDELLLVQRGQELGYKMTEEQFKASVERIKAANKLDDAGFKKAMTERGMTMTELRQQIEREQIIFWVQQNEMTQANLTEEEARQYYQAHPDEFLKPATVTLREIMVPVPSGADPADEQAAQAKAQSARERALKGEDFAKLVDELSESGSKGNGGLIPAIVISNLNDSLRAVIEKLKPGQITEPMRTALGFQLFKVEARVEAELEPFPKVRDNVMQKIYEERIDVETEKMLQRLRGQALIEWKDEQYRVMYEKRMAELKKKATLPQ